MAGDADWVEDVRRWCLAGREVEGGYVVDSPPPPINDSRDAIGDPLTSARLQADLDKIAARWNGLARELNASAQRRVLMARELASGKPGRG